MIDLKQVPDMWQKDSIINNARLDETSRQTPALHSKYLQLWSTAKLELRRAEFDQKRLLKDKWLYYNGKMDQETIKEKGWVADPFDGLKILKNDMEVFYNSDQDLTKLKAQIDYLQETVEYVKRCMDNITWRHQTIKNTIEWRKFMAGQ